MTARNKERTSEFLVLLQALCFITRYTVRSNTSNIIKKYTSRCKNITVIMSSERQNGAEYRLLKLSTIPQYWNKLTGIFESEILSSKQRNVQEQP